MMLRIKTRNQLTLLLQRLLGIHSTQRIDESDLQNNKKSGSELLSEDEKFVKKFVDRARMQSLDTIKDYLKLMLPLNSALIGGYFTFVQIMLKDNIYRIAISYILPPLCFLLSIGCAVWGLIPRFSDNPGGTIESYLAVYRNSVDKRRKWVKLCFFFFIIGVFVLVIIPWLWPIKVITK